LPGPARSRKTPGERLTAGGLLFRLMSREQQQQLFDNIAAAMRGVPEPIQLRQIGHFAKADPAYGRGVAERRGLTSRLAAAE
jgi:catalase